MFYRGRRKERKGEEEKCHWVCKREELKNLSQCSDHFEEPIIGRVSED